MGRQDRVASGDDVRDQLILDLHDLVLQSQLLLLQPTQGQLVRATRQLQRVDGFVKVAVLPPQNLQPDAQHLFEVEL